MTTTPALIALLAVAVATDTELPFAARHMSPDRISGFYALQQSLPSALAECPRTVAFSSHERSEQGIAVIHSSVRLGGASCMGNAALAIAPADHAFENPLYTRARRASPTLEALVRDVVRQRGAFLGISPQPMRCADFSLARDAVFAFVHRRRAAVALLGGRVRLRAAHRHVLVLGKSAGMPLGCVYATAETPAPALPMPSASATRAGAQSAGEVEPQSACFPASATVETAVRGVIRVDALEVGDSVRVRAHQYARVYMFSHRVRGEHHFVRIETRNAALSLSAGHYIYINGGAIPARDAQIGDEIELADGRQVRIERIRNIVAQGLYNPHTVHGDIVVNGVRTSTYTETVPCAAAHALLAPLRAAYSACAFSSAMMENGVPSLALPFAFTNAWYDARVAGAA